MMWWFQYCACRYSTSQLQHLCFTYGQDNGNGATSGTFCCADRSDRRSLQPVSNSDEVDRLKTEVQMLMMNAPCLLKARTVLFIIWEPQKTAAFLTAPLPLAGREVAVRREVSHSLTPPNTL